LKRDVFNHGLAKQGVGECRKVVFCLAELITVVEHAGSLEGQLLVICGIPISTFRFSDL
jgi:hypothetical protein